LDEKRKKNKKEILEKASNLLHQQATKEQAIAPNLRNYIRSVVIGAQQISNINNPSFLSDDSRMEFADIELYIDAADNKIIMKKEGFEPIEFDLTSRMIKTHGVDFGGINGQIVGITDFPWWDDPRSNFIVSEKGLAPLNVNMGDVKDRIEVIIKMLNDMDQLIHDFETRVQDEFDVVNSEVDAVSVDVATGFEDVEARFTTIDGTLSQLATNMNAKFSAVDDEIGDQTTWMAGRFDAVDAEIEAVSSDLQTFSGATATNFQNVRADVAAGFANQNTRFNSVDEQLSAMGTQLNTIQTIVEEILNKVSS
jgi:hypothetical protein